LRVDNAGADDDLGARNRMLKRARHIDVFKNNGNFFCRLGLRAAGGRQRTGESHEKRDPHGLPEYHRQLLS
jgi:hypothetical protein